MSEQQSTSRLGQLDSEPKATVWSAPADRRLGPDAHALIIDQMDSMIAEAGFPPADATLAAKAARESLDAPGTPRHPLPADAVHLDLPLGDPAVHDERDIH